MNKITQEILERKIEKLNHDILYNESRIKELLEEISKIKIENDQLTTNRSLIAQDLYWDASSTIA